MIRLRRLLRLGAWALFALAAFGPLSPRAARAATPLIGYLEAGPELVGQEWFASLAPGLSYESEIVSLHLEAPLRLRMNPRLAAERGALRTADFDELSDAGRVLRKLDLTLAERRVVIHLGELAHESLGHGTILSGYANSLDPARLPVGALARVVAGAMALDLICSDLLAPGLLGGSLTLEPLSLGKELNDRLHLASTALFDRGAPASPASAPVLVYGVGMDVAAYRSQMLTVAPYLDANGRGNGFGLHAGLLADLRLGPVELSAKGEWRRSKTPYQPEYFDVGYLYERFDAERFLDADGASVPVPKADQAFPTANGWRGELRARASAMSAAVSASTRGRGLYHLSAMVDADFGHFDLAMSAAVRGLEDGRAEKVFVAAEARTRVGGYFYVWAHGGQLYTVAAAAAGAIAEPITQLGLGLGAALSP